MHKRLVGQIVALTAVGALALSACSNGSGGGGGGLASGGSGGGDANATYKIGFEGPLSGDNQQLGINEVNAVELAIDEANSGGDLPFKLELVKADDQGSPEQAPTAAQTLLQDASVLGVVGPSFSGATKAVATDYGDAKLVLISPSATNDTLTSQGFTAFHRVVPPDALEGTELANYMVAQGYSKVVVIDDASDYGKGVSDTVQKGIEAGGKTVQRVSVDALSTKDYGPTAQTIAASGAQAFFYGGYDAQAALLAKAVAATSYTGAKYTGNGGKSSVFTEGAGDAGDGWFFSCGCADAVTSDAAKDFTAAYKEKFNTDPSTYSPEAYDATNAMIDAFKTAAADGAPTRETVFDAVGKLDFEGITTTVKFQENGELDASSQVINLFEQTDGVINTLGNIKDQ